MFPIILIILNIEFMIHSKLRVCFPANAMKEVTERNICVLQTNIDLNDLKQLYIIGRFKRI